MSFLIDRDEATAGRRRVPFRLFTSDGTSPDTNASNGTVLGSVNGAAQISMGSISAISANAGLYYAEPTQSNVSVLGSIALYTDTIATDFPQHVANVQVVNFNPMSSQSNVVNVTLAPGSYSDVSVRIGAGDYGSITTFGVSQIAANSYSGVTIQGLSNYANISNVTLAPGTHSNVTIQGVTRVNSSVTIANANYSAVTVRPDLQAYSGLTVGAGNLAPGSYSGVSVGVLDIKPASYSGVSVEIKTGGIQALSFGASAIDDVAVATSTGQEIADRFLARNIAGGSDGGRDVKSSLYPLRNRTFVSGSTGTVYQVDDSTSAWTFSVATVAAQALTELDPGGV